jgi:excisionase family DNA binding protein
MTAAKQYLRAADIAELTGASIRTVRRWIAGEILPSVKVGGARLVAATELGWLLSTNNSCHKSYSDDGE